MTQAPGTTTSAFPVSRVRRRLRVVLIGEFSSGKSTLLNSLLGRSVAAVGPNPTTDRVHVLTGAGPTERERQAVTFQACTGAWFAHGLEIWDTPGVNVANTAHEAASRRAVAQADIVILVVRSDDASTRSAREIVRHVDQACPGRAPHPVVVTKVDQIDSENEDERMEEVAEKREEVLQAFGSRPVFLLDSRDLNLHDGPALSRAITTWTADHLRETLAREVLLPDHWLRHHLAKGGGWRDALSAEEVDHPLVVILDALQATRDKAKTRLDEGLRTAGIRGLTSARRATLLAASNAARLVVARAFGSWRVSAQETARLGGDAFAELRGPLRLLLRAGLLWAALVAVVTLTVGPTWGSLPAWLVADPTVDAVHRGAMTVAIVLLLAPLAVHLALRLGRDLVWMLRPIHLLASIVLVSVWLAGRSTAALAGLALVTAFRWLTAAKREPWADYHRAEANSAFRTQLGLSSHAANPPSTPGERVLPSIRRRAGETATFDILSAAWTRALALYAVPGALTVAAVAAGVEMWSHAPPRWAALRNQLHTTALSWGVVPPGAALDGPVGFHWLPVRGGTFRMGADADPAAQGDETPHEVRLTRSFWVAEAEVSQAQWEQVMASRPWAWRERYWDEEATSARCSDIDDPDLPAVCVSWLDALEFCNALSAWTGLTPAYAIGGDRIVWHVEADGYRLPTEAEWEWVARPSDRDPWGRAPGGTPCEGGVFLDTSTQAAHAWIRGEPAPCDDGFPGMAPVRRAPATARGVRGLVGNVWEWVFDGYAPYESAVNPVGSATAEVRMLRGGAWFLPPRDSRVTNRYAASSTGVSGNVGIRVVRGAYGAPGDVAVPLSFETTSARAFIAAMDAAGRGDEDARIEALRACADHPKLGTECRTRLGAAHFGAGRWAAAVSAWAPVEASLSKKVRSSLWVARRKARRSADPQ